MPRSGYMCVRATFCSLNALIWLLGCGVLGIGVWLRVAYDGYMSLLPQHTMLSMDTLILATGVTLFITAFLGCCGAWCKNKCLLMTYFVLVIVLFIVELTAGILAFIYRQHLGDTLQVELLTGIKYHYLLPSGNETEGGLVVAWDHVQHQFGCCGVQGYTDWFNITAWPDKKYVPTSCCLPIYLNMTECGTLDDSMWYQKGCYSQVKFWFIERLHLVGVAGLVIAFIQLFGLLSSMILFCAARRRRFPMYKPQKSHQ